MKRAPTWMFVLALAANQAHAQGIKPTEEVARVPQDFAEGLSLSIQPTLAVQTLLLPLEVYRGANDELRDLSVFNERGESVPFALRSLSPEVRARREELELPLFPIHRLPEKSSDSGGAISLHVERDAQGSVVDIRVPGTPEGPSARTYLAAYVLDASALTQPASQLRLALDFGTETFTTRVQVEASDDLSSWHTIASGAVLGQLSHAGQSIQRSQIGLAPTRAKFLRLTWSDGPLRVTKAFASFEREQVERERRVVHFESRAVCRKDALYELDLGGVFPLSGLLPLLPENSLIASRLGLRRGKDESEEVVFEGQLYRVKHDGVELHSPALELGIRRARHVSLHVDPRMRAMLPDTLAFDVAYAPDQLLFVTRGKGPYVLAYGSRKTAPRAFEASELLSFIPEEARGALPIESAKVEARRALGGNAARTLPPPERSYRLPILWTILIVGAGTLVLLALRMLRKLR